jgi:dipeptidyl aminopeptidase/acylaminoacyl peptidase
MKRFRSIVPVIIAALLFIVIPAGLFPAGPQAQGQAPPAQQSAGEKKALSIDDYGRWKTIASVAMSEDGQWACYIYRPREGDANLYVRQLDSEKLYTINIGFQGVGGRGAGGGAPGGPAAGGGGGPMFSDDSHWIAYFVNPPERTGTGGARGGAGRGAAPASSGGRGGAAAAATPAPAAAPARKLELLNLANGEKTSWDNVASFAFVEGSRVLIIKRPKLDREAAHNGTDMIIHRLDRGTDELLGSTGEFAVNKGGALLAFTTDAADMTGNGVSVLSFVTGIRKTLDSGKALYERMIWDEEGTALAVLKGAKKTGFVERENSLLAFKAMDKEPERVEFKMIDGADFPKDMVISEKAALSWSNDLSKVFFGIKGQEKEPERRRDDAPAIANVDIWHWKDDRIQAEQMIRANTDRNFTFRADYVLSSKKLVRLTDDTMRTIQLTQDEAWGIGVDERAYISDWEEAKSDYYRVNTTTGERALMFKALGRPLGLSPDSKHWLYWKDGQVWDYLIETGETKNLTQRPAVSFVDKDYDHPGIKPSYGVAGYSKDGKGVIVNHKYDIYLQPYDGSPAVNLTGGLGTREEIRFRYQALEGEGDQAVVTRQDGDEDQSVVERQAGGPGRGGQSRYIDLSKPILLSAYGQWTKKAGYYELNGKDLKKLIYEDKAIGRIVKAKKADRLLFTEETFVDFPNYYLSDTKFANPKQITDANPQQSEYKWGHRILFDFKNKAGVRLQGTLAIPDGYQPGQKLPMLVNFYEKNSQNLHVYQAPVYASSPQFAGFVSQGYLVMQPDIHFSTRTSHSDMLECVEAGIQKVIEMDYVDPKRVGLHGHSYSGQGSAYISTQSKMFAAIVAGAAASDLVSDFNQIWKTSGTNQHRYDIYGQGRFGSNPYDDLQLFMDQSAVFHARTMNTPLLLLHGTDDGSVDWLQGVEFYNALRFNKKNVILLSYPGEAHGLRNLENQKDFLVRIQQFYDHYLKDKPAPDWMVNGVPFLKKAK